MSDDAAGDARLVELVRAGRSEAFGQLVLKYQDRVFNTCWRLCGHLEDARDLTQEAFLRAFEHLGSFRRESRFYTWLFRVAVNLALSHRRRRRRVSVRSGDQVLEGVGGQAKRLLEQVQDASSADAEHEASEAELLGRVAAALHALDEDDRTVVILRDMEGLNYDDIGDILEIPRGTVKSRLHRARVALRNRLGLSGGTQQGAKPPT